MVVLNFPQFVVHGNYVFKVNLVSIINPTDRTANGECCVCCEIGGVCINQCDMVLRFCLRPAGFSEFDPSCPLVELRGPDDPRGINFGVREPWPVRHSYTIVHWCMTYYTNIYVHSFMHGLQIASIYYHVSVTESRCPGCWQNIVD